MDPKSSRRAAKFASPARQRWGEWDNNRVRPRIVLAWLEKTFPFNSTRWEFEA
jgi:hypothetical protein